MFCPHCFLKQSFPEALARLCCGFLPIFRPRSAFFVAAVQESPLLKETSTPSGMQWPGSALSSAEALSASSACVHAILLMHVDGC